MNSVYSNDYLSSLLKVKKRSLIISISAILFGTIFDIFLLLFVNENNKTWFTVILCVVFILFVWVAIYFLIDKFFYSKNRYEIIFNNLAVEEKSITGVIKKINEPITLMKVIRCYEITLLTEDSISLKVYFDDEFVLPFKVGDKVNLATNKNFISKYEVISNE